MNNHHVLVLLVSAMPFGCATPSATRPKPEEARSEQAKTKLVVLKSGEPEELSYDAGTAKFLVSSEDTNGAWILLELKEMPGYKTNIHRHNRTDETFYVLDGVLTIRLLDKVSDYPAGSYVLIPRGTPHAQGNRGDVPVRLLLMMTPGGFERAFRDRIELFKTIKPGDPELRKARRERQVKGNYDVEFLADWDLKN
jgi:quercetin dioxygenase-like cupin family protein